jgi:Spy/CpxP family protein refolding chaperone
MKPVSLTLLVAVLLSAAPAFGDRLKDPFEGMYNPKRLLRGAELTPAQLDAIRAIREPTRAQEREIEKRIDALNTQFAQMYTADKPLDAAEFTRLVDELGELNAQLDRMKAANMVKIRALLTPEQLHRVAAVRQTLFDLEAQKRAIPPTVEGEEGP